MPLANIQGCPHQHLPQSMLQGYRKHFHQLIIPVHQLLNPPKIVPRRQPRIWTHYRYLQQAPSQTPQNHKIKSNLPSSQSQKLLVNPPKHYLYFQISAWSKVFIQPITTTSICPTWNSEINLTCSWSHNQSTHPVHQCCSWSTIQKPTRILRSSERSR